MNVPGLEDMLSMGRRGRGIHDEDPDHHENDAEETVVKKLGHRYPLG